jgi:hypothetical protein
VKIIPVGLAVLDVSDTRVSRSLSAANFFISSSDFQLMSFPLGSSLAKTCDIEMFYTAQIVRFPFARILSFMQIIDCYLRREVCACCGSHLSGVTLFLVMISVAACCLYCTIPRIFCEKQEERKRKTDRRRGSGRREALKMRPGVHTPLTETSRTKLADETNDVMRQ